MRLISILTTLLLLVIVTQAQSRKELAQQAFDNGDYYTAIEQYKKYLEKDRNPGNTGEVYYAVAESYRNLLQYKEALEWYGKAEGAQYAQPNLHFQQGKVALNLAMYDKARNSLNQFLTQQPNDKDAMRLLASIDFVEAAKKDPPPLHTVVNEQQLNTSFSDYGAFSIENKVVFTSSRQGEGVDNKTYLVDGQGFSNLLTTRYDNAAKLWDKPEVIGTLSSGSFNDGVFSYSPQSKMGYYTQCSGEKGAKCRIMEARYNGVGWDEPKPISYGGEPIEMVHPSVSADGSKLLVVTRDLEGEGGADLWLLTRQGTDWSEPQKIPNINTEYDEVYPVWQNDTTLYLSSNGYVGFGGLDLFVSVNRGGQWSKPTNLKLPFNSSADDFLLTHNADFTKGYFSSNRPGGVGSDDVYSFFLTPISLTLKGHVTDVATGGGLAGVKVYLNTADGNVDSAFTDANGNYSFTLDKNQDYKITVNLPEYFGDSRKLSTVGELYSKEFSKENGYNFDFQLMRIPEEEITIDDIFYDYNVATLREESKVSLDKLVKLLDDSPDISVVINAHTDERGEPKYNLKLSQDRAQSVLDYLVAHGINPVRLESKGWGKTAPLVKNAQTEEEHQQNRRTTFLVVK